jgi:hypothetical protein
LSASRFDDDGKTIYNSFPDNAKIKIGSYPIAHLGFVVNVEGITQSPPNQLWATLAKRIKAQLNPEQKAIALLSAAKAPSALIDNIRKFKKQTNDADVGTSIRSVIGDADSFVSEVTKVIGNDYIVHLENTSIGDRARAALKAIARGPGETKLTALTINLENGSIWIAGEYRLGITATDVEGVFRKADEWQDAIDKDMHNIVKAEANDISSKVAQAIQFK